MASDAFNKITRGLEDAKAYRDGEREGFRVTVFSEPAVLTATEVKKPAITAIKPR